MEDDPKRELLFCLNEIINRLRIVTDGRHGSGWWNQVGPLVNQAEALRKAAGLGDDERPAFEFLVTPISNDDIETCLPETSGYWNDRRRAEELGEPSTLIIADPLGTSWFGVGLYMVGEIVGPETANSDPPLSRLAYTPDPTSAAQALPLFEQWVRWVEHHSSTEPETVDSDELKALPEWKDDGQTVHQYVTLNQMAAIVSRSKRTLERKKTSGDLPAPDIEGGGGNADEWRWDRVRPWLVETYRKDLPEHFPQMSVS